MAAIDITAIREQIANLASTVDGLQDAKAYRPDNAMSGTAFWVELDAVDAPTLGNRARWSLSLECHLETQGTHDRSKAEVLDELVPLVWKAIESDRTLAGFAGDVAVLGVTMVRDVADGEPLGARFEIRVEVRET